ncbi:DUF4440 domain-containing protein [Microbacterium sp. NPDC096154]|uniref:DUF4440 domain-containing protein n=1 Tax=Microbacterium sp. NPDC096154 TaxID=3155549 RepID=UPI00332BDB1C
MSGVRQLRVVVEAADFDDALRFYRDVLGLTEQESFHGDAGARVTILNAGSATLELSNPAQVELIDRVETDGDRSDRIRLAFEGDDSAAITTRLAEAGATVTATPRETPWRSLNARLRAPADLQITLFQELEDHSARVADDGFRTEPAPDVDAVLALERELQTPQARRDPARLERLLAPDFTEIGASGQVWDRAAIGELLAHDDGDGDGDEEPIEVLDLAGRNLTDGLVLVTWRSQRSGRSARRSSLWRHDPDGWRLVHHQGTPLPSE